MNTKENFLSNVKSGESVKISLMVMKILFRDPAKIVCILADKSGETKANLSNKKDDITDGIVLEVEGIKDGILDVKKYEIITSYSISDYLPTVNRPVDDIMQEIELYTSKYIISKEAKALNDYFFKDEEFLDKFKRGIGGISMHHNYIGGLAEHTLNVMHLTLMLCERYGCRRTEICHTCCKTA
jgi:Predicted HD-superfamily hydrolase